MIAFEYCRLHSALEHSDRLKTLAWQYTPTGPAIILEDSTGYRQAGDTAVIAAMGKVLIERGWMKINDRRSNLFKRALPNGQQESHTYRFLQRDLRTIRVGLFRKEELGECELLQITPDGLVTIRLEVCTWSCVRKMENRMSSDLLQQGWQRVGGYFVKADKTAETPGTTNCAHRRQAFG